MIFKGEVEAFSLTRKSSAHNPAPSARPITRKTVNQIKWFGDNHFTICGELGATNSRVGSTPDPEIDRSDETSALSTGWIVGVNNCVATKSPACWSRTSFTFAAKR